MIFFYERRATGCKEFPLSFSPFPFYEKLWRKIVLAIIRTVFNIKIHSKRVRVRFITLNEYYNC